MRPVRRMRHWKQRFNKDAKFTWIKPVTWQGKQVKIGDPIPKSLTENRNKLRRFWEAGVIQLSDFSAPDVITGQAPATAATAATADTVVPGELIKHSDRKWTISGYDEIYTSKGKAQKALDDFNEAAADDEADILEDLMDEAEAENAERDLEADDWLDGTDTANTDETATENADEAETGKEA